MPTNRKIASIILGLITLLIAIHSCTFLVRAQSQNNEIASIRLVVHIFDIDPTQKLVQLELNVFIDDFPYNESRVNVGVIGAGYAMVQCNNTGPKTADTWYFQGKSKRESWLLEGLGENFPFDSYGLRFRVDGVGFIDQNFTLSSEGHQAFFTGPRTYYLKDLWRTDHGLLPLIRVHGDELSVVIERAPDNIKNAFLQLLLPIIGCYYLLGTTSVLDPKEKLAERLRIHLSLFVFAPTFLIAIQRFLPYRTSLAFPEFLLANLVISNIICGIFSILGSQKSSSKETGVWNRIASFLSVGVFLIIYAFTLFSRINTPASVIISSAVIPSYIIFYFAVMSKEELMRQKYWIVFLLASVLIPLILFLLLPFI